MITFIYEMGRFFGFGGFLLGVGASIVQKEPAFAFLGVIALLMGVAATQIACFLNGIAALCASLWRIFGFFRSQP